MLDRKRRVALVGSMGMHSAMLAQAISKSELEVSKQEDFSEVFYPTDVYYLPPKTPRARKKKPHESTGNRQQPKQR